MTNNNVCRFVPAEIVGEDLTPGTSYSKQSRRYSINGAYSPITECISSYRERRFSERRTRNTD